MTTATTMATCEDCGGCFAEEDGTLYSVGDEVEGYGYVFICDGCRERTIRDAQAALSEWEYDVPTEEDEAAYARFADSDEPPF